MDISQIKSGRTPFSPPSGKVDFSGEDFEKVYFSSLPSLDHAYLNGIQAVDCGFHNINMVQVEMSQSEVSISQFAHVDMTGTDLVESLFTDVAFYKCSFKEGEWRESFFVRCSFNECDFDHTTVNLCIFQGCKFDSKSAKHFQQMGKIYNTFIGCEFLDVTTNDVVLARNFSLPSSSGGKAICVSGSGVSLETVCMASASGVFDVEPIAMAIENELSGITRLKTMKLNNYRLMPVGSCSLR
jgi:uncharacterized protein YjbI with pentapeptide repeats